MSNRDPLYGDSSKKDDWGNSTDSFGQQDSSLGGGSSLPEDEAAAFDNSFGSESDSGFLRLDDTAMDTGSSFTSGSTGSESSSVSDSMHSIMDDATSGSGMTDKAMGMMEDGKQKAGEMAGMAQERVDGGMTKAGETMDSAAQMLREKAEQLDGPMATAAGTAAGAMEAAGSFLQGNNTSDMMDQVESYIRENPTQGLLIAAGVGFVIAKAVK